MSGPSLSDWMHMSESDRFWARVDQTGDCWLWIGELNNMGYGIFKTYADGGRTKHLAHRYSARAAGIAIDGKVLRHSCDTPRCVRPDHLTPGTQADNIRDAIERGRLDMSGLAIGQYGSTREFRRTKGVA